MRIDSAGWTHVGRRSHDEDAWTARADLGLFVVADGLGGYEGGEGGDGLYEPLGPERIAARLGRGGAAAMAEALVEDAYAAGGHDNITAVVVGVRAR